MLLAKTLSKIGIKWKVYEWKDCITASIPLDVNEYIQSNFPVSLWPKIRNADKLIIEEQDYVLFETKLIRNYSTDFTYTELQATINSFTGWVGYTRDGHSRVTVSIDENSLILNSKWFPSTLNIYQPQLLEVIKVSKDIITY